MPNVFFDNIDKWKKLSDIDYFTQFMKAWLVFNGWMSNATRERTDRAMLDNLKNNSNIFKSNIIGLINSNTNEADVFKSYLGKLHQELERMPILNRGEQITFRNAFIENNATTTYTHEDRRVTYKVERQMPNRPRKEVKVTIINRAGNIIYTHTQPNGFNLTELRDERDYQRLRQNQKANLEISYNTINPKTYKNILAVNGNIEGVDYFKAGNLRFCKDDEAFCKAFIEIFYKLRCVLFHGEIVPDRNHNRIYEAAYHLLKILIDAL